MIRKVVLFLILILILGTNVTYAKNNLSITPELQIAEEYENENGFKKFLWDITDTLKKTILHEYTVNIKRFLIIVFVCIFTALSTSFSNTSSIIDTVKYASVIVCGLCYVPQYNSLISSGFKTVADMSDYMNITFPGILTLLVGSGYESTAVAMNTIFIIVSNIVSVIVAKIILPLIYSGMILTLSNGICCSTEISKITNSIIKVCKYILGLILTIFCTILTLIGFTARTKDTIALKTIKYAAANFVPIVGGCLSETFESIINSSSIIKSTVGYTGTIAVIAMSLIPLIKIVFMIFITKSISVISSMVSIDYVSNMLESVSEILKIVGALLVLLIIIYILMFGIIASIGG